MKNIFYSIIACLALAMAVSCTDDNNGIDQPIVIDLDQMPIDFAPVDLDGEWTKLTGSVSSDVDLAKVSFVAVSGDKEEAFQEVSSFDGGSRSYDFEVEVPWTVDVSFVKVIAENTTGDVVEISRKVLIKGGPVIDIEATEFVIDLSVSAKDTIQGTIKSESGLSEVLITVTKKGEESTYKKINPSGADANELNLFEIITFDLDHEAFNILATDAKGNTASHDITVSVVESPVYTMFAYSDIELHGTDKRKTGVDIGVSLSDGKSHAYDPIIADANGLDIDFMISSADSGSPQVRYFSPATEYGDKFKLGTEGNADIVLNDTQFSKLDRGDAAFFAAATAESIQAMSLTDEGADATDILKDINHDDNGVDIINGKVVYFETAWGAQCLVMITETIDNNGNRKGDSYMLDFKVVYQTN
ncbi:hypothetical protein N7E81_09495 [Reichenbachiella carrageenanivorans]|uniref:Uncharacterized protein n=1 Tax=Reichenbachiella carrageenanivorans TaxID=2979869 RepID=A0ABY6D5Y8_9BACT|nr:hypothetical protein [Reichenbachiella carrageenanivorans]UXX81324.1 hypothetical protein N7E81_09495 [Reichenbachiella carrageenanivorans]